jgi:hypothetical protein
VIELPKLFPWQWNVLHDPARFKCVKAARQIGKSELALVAAAITALNGGIVGYFLPRNSMMNSIFRRFERILGDVCDRKNRTTREMELTTGGAIYFFSLENSSTSCRGHRFHLVIIDEVSFVTNHDLPELWESEIMPTFTTTNGKALFISSPKGRNHFTTFYEKAKKDPDWKSWSFDQSANPTIDKETLRRNLERTDPIGRQEYKADIIESGEGVFLDEDLKAITAAPNGNPVKVFGIDPAYSHDWCCVVGLDSVGRLAQFHRFQMEFSKTKDKLIEIVGKTPALVDATGIGSTIYKELKKNHANFKDFYFSPQSRQELLEKLAKAIGTKSTTISLNTAEEAKHFVHKQLPNGYRWETTAEHDDCVFAHALALEGLGWSPIIGEVLKAKPTEKTPDQRQKEQKQQQDKRLNDFLSGNNTTHRKW